jgi:O-antigen/teichoic acid export membrane protein
VAEVTVGKLARGALLWNGAQFWAIASRLVLTPIVLDRIGLAGFGAWSLLFGLTSYVTMIDASFATAYGKLTAELDRRRDHALLAEAIGAGIAALGAVALVGVAALWFAAPLVLPPLGVPEALRADARVALLLVSLAAALQVSFGGVQRVLEGYQRLDLRVAFDVAGSITDFVVCLPLLFLDFGLVALGTGYLIGRVVAMAGAWWGVRRSAPELRLSPRRMSRSGLRAVLSLGARFQGLAVLNTVAGEAVRMLISALCGISSLGALELARRLLSLATTPASSIVAPLLAAFANLDAGGDRVRWQRLLERSSKLLGCAALAALAFAALFAEPLLYAWTARQVPEAVFTARVLAVSSFFRLLTGVGTASLRAAGTVRLEFQYGALGATGSLLGTLLGYAWAGYPGVIVALACAQVIGAAYFLVRFAQVRALSLRRYLARAVARPAGGVLPVLALVAVASLWLPELRTFDGGRLVVLANLAVVVALALLAGAPLLWWGVLSGEERAAARGLVARRLAG